MEEFFLLLLFKNGVLKISYILFTLRGPNPGHKFNSSLEAKDNCLTDPNLKIKKLAQNLLLNFKTNLNQIKITFVLESMRQFY